MHCDWNVLQPLRYKNHQTPKNPTTLCIVTQRRHRYIVLRQYQTKLAHREYPFKYRTKHQAEKFRLVTKWKQKPGPSTFWPSWGSHASEKRANRSRFALDRFKKIQYSSVGIPNIRLFVSLTYTALANDGIHNKGLLVTAMCTSVMLDDDELMKKWKKIDEKIIFSGDFQSPSNMYKQILLTVLVHPRGGKQRARGRKKHVLGRARGG